jgi:5'-nucleotidase
VPSLPREQIKGVEITRLGKRVYRDVLVERKDPRGRNYYWIGGEPPHGVAEQGTDFTAITDGKVSITPIHLDLTNHRLIEKLKGWRLTME